MNPDSSLAIVFTLLWRFAANSWTRWGAAWLFCLGLATHLQHKAIHSFDVRKNVPVELRRRDGNDGHTSIDFGGQWIMGRMLMTGHGRELYDRNVQREVVTAAFPREDEAPEPKSHDADDMMRAFMAVDEPREERARQTRATFPAALMAATPVEALTLTAAAQKHWTDERIAEASTRSIGGPLYPPIQAVLFAPLAQKRPAKGLPGRPVDHARRRFRRRPGDHRATARPPMVARCYRVGDDLPRIQRRS